MSGLLESLKSMYAHDAIVLAGIENGNVRGIPLTQGKIALVDDEDYEWLNQWKWCAAKGRNGYTSYAVRSHKRKKGQNRLYTLMHRQIVKCTRYDGTILDHINRNGLDNRKINLRIATYTLNAINHKQHKYNTSGYMGVDFDKRREKWRTRISINGRKIHCGYFINAVSAAEAYDEIAINNFGRNIALNFPRGGNNVI